MNTKSRLKHQRHTSLLLLWFCLTASQGVAQTYQALHTFTGTDGLYPNSLVLSGTNLYGMTGGGGGNDNYGGTLYKLNLDGSGYTVLKRWTVYPGASECYPMAPPLVSGGTLYGTTGGWIPVDIYGSVFKVNTDGSGYTMLKGFLGSDGYWPRGNLVLSGTTLYGTTGAGGPSGHGTVFRVNTDGSGFAVLKDFSDPDSYSPVSGLVLLNTTLYGSALSSGLRNGVIFRIQTDGSAFAIVKSALGGSPSQPLLLSGTTLYGATMDGGGSGMGTIFKVGTDGEGFTVIRSFSLTDGARPSSLVLAGTTLFGTCDSGGHGHGNVFKVNTDGTGFAVLKEFHGTDGTEPRALVLAGNTFYGVTFYGGNTVGDDQGVVFALAFEPPRILSPPPSQTAQIGDSVCFAIKAECSQPLSYQWYFNGTNMLGGCTNRTVLRTNAQPSHAGAYTVVVTDLLGHPTNATAILQVIPPVEHRPVPAINVAGRPGEDISLDYRNSLSPAENWETMATMTLSTTSQYYFDISAPLPPQRFYRAWQAGASGAPPGLVLPFMVPAITLTGSPGNSIRVDGINQIGPTDAWFTVDTVTLTNATQLYFDLSAPGQPQRLYRLVSLP